MFWLWNFCVYVVWVEVVLVDLFLDYEIFKDTSVTLVMFI